jgi:ankyrin repeat protein
VFFSFEISTVPGERVHAGDAQYDDDGQLLNSFLADPREKGKILIGLYRSTTWREHLCECSFLFAMFALLLHWCLFFPFAVSYLGTVVTFDELSPGTEAGIGISFIPWAWVHWPLTGIAVWVAVAEKKVQAELSCLFVGIILFPLWLIPLIFVSLREFWPESNIIAIAVCFTPVHLWILRQWWRERPNPPYDIPESERGTVLSAFFEGSATRPDMSSNKRRKAEDMRWFAAELVDVYRERNWMVRSVSDIALQSAIRSDLESQSSMDLVSENLFALCTSLGSVDHLVFSVLGLLKNVDVRGERNIQQGGVNSGTLPADTPLSRSTRRQGVGRDLIAYLLDRSPSSINAIENPRPFAQQRPPPPPPPVSRGDAIENPRPVAQRRPVPPPPPVSRGRTPLLIACEYGLPTIVQLLIQLGADLEYQRPADLRTPLMVAAQGGHRAIVALLSEANHEATDCEKETAAHVAAAAGHVEVVDQLSENRDPRTLLNMKNEKHWTPLTVAVVTRHSHFVEHLVETYASELELDSQDREGNTALHHARRSELSAVVQLLVDKGADPKLENFLKEPAYPALAGITGGSSLNMSASFEEVQGSSNGINAMARAPVPAFAARDFEELRLVASGAHGRVTECRIKDLPGKFAVKRMRADVNGGAAMASMEKELELLGGLRHDNIAALVGYAREPTGAVALVMELYDNSLAGLINQQNAEVETLGWFEGSDVGNWLWQIALGLCYLHDKVSPAVAHRDIKTDNCLVEMRGIGEVRRVLLADFGIGKVLEASGTLMGQTMSGTPGYMAPEMASGTYDPLKCDMFAFGIVALVFWVERSQRR